MTNQGEPIKFDLIELGEDFSYTSFVKLFCRNNNANNIEYLKEYFDKILRYLYHYVNYKDSTGHVVKTVIIEYPYFSESYINDYSEFYSKIFKDHERETSRLHFFTESFDENQFRQMMREPNDKSLKKYWDSYIGYIVEKPLPNSIIGATLLLPYQDDVNLLNEEVTPVKVNKVSQRFYNSVREYKATIGAKTLKLKTLVFQQQDRAVSACATISLWVAINMLHKIFECQMIQPSQITGIAGEKLNAGRKFPNNGLDANQIVRVINKIGLVSEVLTIQKSVKFETKIRIQDEPERKLITNKILKENVYAYNRVGIPLLLGYKIKNRIRGNHLTTIAGYRLGSKFKEEYLANANSEEETLLLKSHLIERLYVHDDQLGPFTRIEFSKNDTLKTKWINKDSVESLTKILIIPVEDEIRLKYDDVARISKYLNEVLKNLIKKLDDSFDDFYLVWDIFLQASNQYKKDSLEDETLNVCSDEIISTPFPKFIWVSRVEILVNNNTTDSITLMDFIFDSSEIGVGVNFYKLFFFDKSLQTKFNEGFETEKSRQQYKEKFKHNPAIVKKLIDVIAS